MAHDMERPRSARHCGERRQQEDGAGRRTGFVITAASEIMAIIALPRIAPTCGGGWKISLWELLERENLCCEGPAGRGRDDGSADRSVQPNLVQTIEGSSRVMFTPGRLEISPTEHAA